MPRDSHHDDFTVGLHWLTAGLIAALWRSAQIIAIFGHGPPEAYHQSFHITLGVMRALVLAVRILWRLTAGRSQKGAHLGLLEQIARATHYVMHAVAGTVVLLGCLTVWMQGDRIWSLVPIPAYDPGNITLGQQIRGWHGVAANLILILAGLHAAAALFHHDVLRDDMFRRMLPRL